MPLPRPLDVGKYFMLQEAGSLALNPTPPGRPSPMACWSSFPCIEAPTGQVLAPGLHPNHHHCCPCLGLRRPVLRTQSNFWHFPIGRGHLQKQFKTWLIIMPLILAPVLKLMPTKLAVVSWRAILVLAAIIIRSRPLCGHLEKQFKIWVNEKSKILPKMLALVP